MTETAMSKTETCSPKKYWLDAWHVNPAANRDYEFIDGLRGVAILLVLLCHHIYFNPKAGPLIQFAGAFSAGLGNGVILFFAISGFLISWPFWKRKFANAEKAVPTGYARRRFWKIYPPLALSIVLLTPFYVLWCHDRTFIPLAAQWLAGIPFFWPVSGKLNPVMWTLVVEVQFYMVLPLVFGLLKSVSARSCLWLIPLIFLLVPILFQAFTGLHAEFNPEINSHFPSALDAFGLGILVAGLDNRGGLGGKWAWLAVPGALLFLLGLLLDAWVHTHPAGPASALGPCATWLDMIGSGCLLCFVANPKLRMARLLCSPALRWCGIISYEWYLLHQPIIQWARQFHGPTGGNVARFAALIGGSLLLSGVLSASIYRFFSLPLLKYGRGGK